jgi:hypothetical protein
VVSRNEKGRYTWYKEAGGSLNPASVRKVLHDHERGGFLKWSGRSNRY